MSSPNSLYSYHKDELLNSLQRFDGEITEYDEVDSLRHDNSKYIHTSFLEVLLECICGSFVKNDVKRQILLTELCKRLSESKLINEELLFHTLPLRKQLSRMFFDFIKKVCKDAIPDAEIDFSSISFLEENCTSFDNVYRTYFEELEEIGRGGFGVVCKARNKTNNSIYAVKKIHFNYKNDSRLRRVIREAKKLALLNHPNVVHYDSAWTESPTSDDDFDFSSSDSEDSCVDVTISSNSKKTNSIKIKRNRLCSSGEAFRADEYKRVHQKTMKENSLNNDSNSIIFSENYETSTVAVWSVGSDSMSKGLSLSDIAQNEKNDGFNLSSSDSEKSDDSVNWNVKAILYIQMEYCDCDLRLWLDEKAQGNSLPFEMNVTDMLIHILNGVAHIHSKNIIHRDLKPQNIFYSKSSNTLKIGDFGLATLACCTDKDFNDHTSCLHSANIGTLPYAAPEQLKHQLYDTKVDIYSLGIIAIELLNTFSTRMELKETIDEIKEGHFPVEMEKSPKLMTLVTNLVSEDPDKRMSAKEILNYLQEDIKITLEARELAIREKEIYLNEKVEELKQKEAAIISEKEREIARLKEIHIKVLREKEEIAKEIETLKETHIKVLREKEEEIARLKTLVMEAQNLHINK